MPGWLGYKAYFIRVCANMKIKSLIQYGNDTPAFFIVVLTIILAIVLGFSVAEYGVPLLDILIKKSVSSDGGLFNLGVIFLSFIFMLFFLFFLIKGSLKTVLFLYIVALPATYRFQGFWSITAFAKEGDPPELVSATTLLIFAILSVFIVKGVVLRKKNHFFGYLEYCILAFAFLGTISQFINHDLWSAFWLSIKSLWQYVALFYLVGAAISNEDDVKFIIKAVVISILVGIVFRQGTFGLGFIFANSQGLQRIGGGAFGPAVSYGGYLSFAAILSLYLAKSSSKLWLNLLWLLATGLILFELINTHTRGAILSFLIVVFLVVLSKERKFILLLIICTIFSFLLTGLWSDFLYLISERDFTLSTSILQDPNVKIRFELWALAFPRIFDGFGFGYGIGNLIYLYTSVNREFTSHNMLLELTQEVGAIASIFFLMFYVSVISRLLKWIKKTTLIAYLFVSLLGWFIFANTTSTSIVYYYPCEATILMYSILFSAKAITDNGGSFIGLDR